MQLANLQGIEAVAILTSNFLSTLPTALAITLVPGALMGIVGAYLSSKKIAIPTSHLGLLTQQEKQQDRKVSQERKFYN
jgi:cobyrinic acid a,c-diamide synthase